MSAGHDVVGKMIEAVSGQSDFTDAGSGVPDQVPIEVVDEIPHRTPGFSGWAAGALDLARAHDRPQRSR